MIIILCLLVLTILELGCDLLWDLRFSSVGDSSNSVLVRHPNSHCAGKEFVGNVGVLHWFNSARCMSDLANCAFFRRALRTYFYGTLFCCWIVGNVGMWSVMCWKSHCEPNFQNSSEEYAGPLSDTRLSRMPWHPNIIFKA